MHLDTYIYPHQHIKFHLCYFYHNCYHCYHFKNIEYQYSIDKTVFGNVEEVIVNADDELGHIFKIDFEYPADLHDEHFDLHLAADRLVAQADSFSEKQKTIYGQIYGKRSFNFTQKLVPNRLKEIEYVMHERNLRQCLEMGLIVTRVYAAITFDQPPWLHEHIGFQL